MSIDGKGLSQEEMGIDSKENVDKLRQEIAEKKKEEREKIEQYGKIGQKVKIKDRSNEELIGEIVGIDIRVPFDDEKLDEWMKKEDDENISSEELQKLPSSVIKVYVTEGERKGTIVDHLVFSEWDPVE